MCKGRDNKTFNSGSINIKAFNVEGLERELENPLFIDSLYESDICVLYETWRGSDTKIALPRLWDFSLVRQKTKKGEETQGVSQFSARIILEMV